MSDKYTFTDDDLREWETAKRIVGQLVAEQVRQHDEIASLRKENELLRAVATELNDNVFWRKDIDVTDLEDTRALLKAASEGGE